MSKYKGNMQKIMDHMIASMKKLEKEITSTYKAWENDKEPDPKPGQEPTAAQMKKDEEQQKLEEKAADVFEQFHNFQMTCSKMEDTAQRFGLANHGEAKDLNCDLDPKEKDEAYKALDLLTELMQAKLGIL